MGVLKSPFLTARWPKTFFLWPELFFFGVNNPREVKEFVSTAVVLSLVLPVRSLMILQLLFIYRSGWEWVSYIFRPLSLKIRLYWRNPSAWTWWFTEWIVWTRSLKWRGWWRSTGYTFEKYIFLQKQSFISSCIF